VLISGKKAAGFLLETAHVAGRPPAAVVGCGINVSRDAFPAEIADSATAINSERGAAMPRRRLAVSFLRSFQRAYRLFEHGEQARILEIWKGMSSMWDGVPVWIHEGDRRTAAVTCGLSETGALLVKTDSGREEALLAADVTVRSK